MRPKKYRIELTASEKAELQSLVRRPSTAQCIVRRAQIILLADGEKSTNKEIAHQVGMYKCDITRWTKRWVERASEPIEKRLGDAQRSGAPERITGEQWCQIIALACESPEDQGLPMTHWTHRELAKEVVKQGIVDTISPSHLGATLKKRFAAP